MPSAKIGVKIEFLVAHPDRSIETPADETRDQRWPEGPHAPLPLSTSGIRQVREAASNCAIRAAEVVSANTLPTACPLPDTWNGDRGKSLRAMQLHHGGLTTLRFSGDGDHHLVWNADELQPSIQRHRHSHWLLHPALDLTYRLVRDRPMRCAPPGYQWHGLTLSSAILYHDLHFERNLPEMDASLASLASEMKIWLNSDTGMRIHASGGGNFTRNEAAYDSRTRLDPALARNVAALALLIEDAVLYGMAHPCRRFLSSNCPPIGEQSMIAEKKAVVHETVSEDASIILAAIREEMDIASQAAVKPQRDLDELFRIMTEILTQPTVHDLRRGLGVLDNDAFSDDLVSRAGLAITRLNTIEFRYPEASFDMSYINFWVTLVRRLMEICQRPVYELAETFRRVFALVAQPGKMRPIREWIETLGLEEWADYCEWRQKEYTTTLLELDKQKIIPHPDL